MNKKNALYAQSGGVTAVINASATGVIHACRKHSNVIGKLFASQNGILGVMQEELFDTNTISNDDLTKIMNSPGAVFGSCRYKLDNIQQNKDQYRRIVDVFSAYDIEYFFYNGGNDSADTCLKISQISQEMGYPIKAIHIPKTIDNDLVITDNCPGFGSVAKYVAISTLEASYDLKSMYKTSTKVFIMEVMGRNAGWIAASTGIVNYRYNIGPHIILLPEVVFNETLFLIKVEQTIKEFGYCVIVASEGIKKENSKLLSSCGSLDSFGHIKLGGVANVLADMVGKNLKYKCHYSIIDYLQRSARHIISKTDLEQSYSVGFTGVEYAISGMNSVMPYIKRISQEPYLWDIDYAPLSLIANKEKFMSSDFISQDGFNITQKCYDYILPLIDKEEYPIYKNGLPEYYILNQNILPKKLKEFGK